MPVLGREASRSCRRGVQRPRGHELTRIPSASEIASVAKACGLLAFGAPWRAMFTLGVSDHVMIAHSFADPFFGPAQRLHGATYAIEVEVCTSSLGPHNVVMDIGALRAIVRAALDTFDYTNLDDHAAFS